jgi:hypothetical protein
MLGEGTETATLAWLVSALKHAIIRGRTKLVGYLEAVVEDVVIEVEAAARRHVYKARALLLTLSNR